MFYKFIIITKKNKDKIIDDNKKRLIKI